MAEPYDHGTDKTDKSPSVSFGSARSEREQPEFDWFELDDRLLKRRAEALQREWDQRDAEFLHEFREAARLYLDLIDD